MRRLLRDAFSSPFVRVSRSSPAAQLSARMEVAPPHFVPCGLGFPIPVRAGELDEHFIAIHGPL